MTTFWVTPTTLAFVKLMREIYYAVEISNTQSEMEIKLSKA